MQKKDRVVHITRPLNAKPGQKNYSAVISPPIGGSKDSLRAWWASVREKGQYKSYAIFLVLPSDRAASRYMSEFGKELHLLSGKDCLVIALGSHSWKPPSFDAKAWSDTVREHSQGGQCLQIGNFFEVEFSQYPCLLVFQDINHPEHVLISMTGNPARGKKTVRPSREFCRRRTRISDLCGTR